MREVLVVLRADGVVELTDGAVVGWRGHRLTEIVGVAPELLAAAATLLAPGGEGLYVRRIAVTCAVDGVPSRVDVLRLDAVPLRRTHARVFDVILRALDPLMVQAQAAGVTLHVERDDATPPSAHLDEEKLAWAVTTLVGSALRHAPRGTELRVRLRFVAETDEVALAVTDQGPGVPASVLPHLFARNPATGRPAGLALLLVRDVAIAHGGTVTATSERGRGTTIEVRLPRHG